MALCGRGLVGFVHPGLLDVRARPSPNKKAPRGAFLLSGLNARGLNPSHPPGQQNGQENKNRKPHTQRQSAGHAVAFLFLRTRAAHHEKQGGP